MKIEKYKLWLLFFFIIFGFTFGMIIWTLKSPKIHQYMRIGFLNNYHT